MCGLILVDIKYEFGRDVDGTIRFIDEINMLDSLRYWLLNLYVECYVVGMEFDMIDKEFLCLWFVERCDSYKDETFLEASADFVVEFSLRYVKFYEMIMGEIFDVLFVGVDVNKCMCDVLKGVI